MNYVTATSVITCGLKFTQGVTGSAELDNVMTWWGQYWIWNINTNQTVWTDISMSLFDNSMVIL